MNAAAIRLMADKGLSAQDIAEIAEASERRADPTAAERKRRQRANEKVERDMSQRDVTRDKGSNDRDILTSPENKKPKPKGLVKKRMPIPDDWQPVEFAIGSESRKVVDGWPPGEMAAQLEQLKAYHRSKHNTFLDPQDAWSTWVLNTRKWGIGRHERSDRDQTTVALERLLGGNVGAHAGAGQIAQAGRSDHDER